MKRILAPTLLALLVGGLPAGAQEAPDAWRVQFDLGFNGASGNSSFSILRTGFSVKHLRTTVAEFDVSGVLRYGESDGEVIANDMRGSVKFDLHPQSVFSPFVFVDASRDRIRRVDLRTSGGLGTKWTFWMGEKGKASFSGAGIWDHENFDLDATSTQPETQTDLRLSWRIKGEKTIGDGTTVEHTTFYQPVWKEWGDYRVEMINTFSTKIMENLSLGIEHEYLHDDTPATGVKPDDNKLSILLRVTL